MADSLLTNEPDSAREWQRAWLLYPLAVALAVFLAHYRALACPFFFDDYAYMIEYKAIRSLAWPWAFVTGNTRPLLYLSFAIGYALHGFSAWAFHAENLAIHIASSLLLFGILHRTLRRVCKDRPPVVLLRAAALGAVLWGVHPVHVNVTAYVWQRGESLMALCYLLTLYAAIRAIDCPRRRGWTLLAVAACIAGALTKEVIATAPLVVLLYDWAYGAGRVREALSRRWRLYLGLLASWLILGFMIWRGREGFHGNPGVGFGSTVYTPCEYVLTMPGVHLKYLQLALWPAELCFDWNWPAAYSLRDAMPALLVAVLLLVGVLWLMMKHRRAGAPLAAYLLIFGPTSSIMPMPDPLIEYRLYLPLTMLAALAAAGVVLAGRRRWAAVALMAAAILALGMRSSVRYEDFATPMRLWQVTFRQRPDNRRAFYSLWMKLMVSPHRQSIIDEYAVAAKKEPSRLDAHLMLAEDALRRFANDEAAAHLDIINERWPENALGRLQAARLNERQGRFDKAEGECRAALSIKPIDPEAHAELAKLLARRGAFGEAKTHARQALRVWLEDPLALTVLGCIALAESQEDAAADFLGRALMRKPDFVPARFAFATLQERKGNPFFAEQNYRLILEEEPENAAAHERLALLLDADGRVDEAAAHRAQAARFRGSGYTPPFEVRDGAD